MSCSDIYDRLGYYWQSNWGEPHAKQLCHDAVDEMYNLLDTISEQNARIDALVLENCGLKAQLADANRLIESKTRIEQEEWERRGYA